MQIKLLVCAKICARACVRQPTTENQNHVNHERSEIVARVGKGVLRLTIQRSRFYVIWPFWFLSGWSALRPGQMDATCWCNIVQQSHCCTMLYDVERSLTSMSNVLNMVQHHFFCSQVWKTMLNLFAHDVHHCWTRACQADFAGLCIHGNNVLFIFATRVKLPRECSRWTCSIANKQSLNLDQRRKL